MRIPEYPKSEVEIQQEAEGYTPAKWWQAIDSDGKLLAETSTREDFENLGLLADPTITFQRLYETVQRRWVEEHPFPDTLEWRQIPGFPSYEMTEVGRVRTVKGHEELKPVFVDEEGKLGFLLRKGIIQAHFLRSTHDLFVDTFPDIAEAQRIRQAGLERMANSDIQSMPIPAELVNDTTVVWWQAKEAATGNILAETTDMELFRNIGFVGNPRVNVLQFTGFPPSMPQNTDIRYTEHYRRFTQFERKRK